LIDWFIGVSAHNMMMMMMETMRCCYTSHRHPIHNERAEE
jgi:hypothetical protein